MKEPVAIEAAIRRDDGRPCGRDCLLKDGDQRFPMRSPRTRGGCANAVPSNGNRATAIDDTDGQHGDDIKGRAMRRPFGSNGTGEFASALAHGIGGGIPKGGEEDTQAGATTRVGHDHGKTGPGNDAPIAAGDLRQVRLEKGFPRRLNLDRTAENSADSWVLTRSVSADWMPFVQRIGSLPTLVRSGFRGQRKDEG